MHRKAGVRWSDLSDEEVKAVGSSAYSVSKQGGRVVAYS